MKPIPFEHLETIGMVPIVCPPNEATVKTLIAATEQTPVNIMEVVFRHPYALTALRLLKAAHPDWYIGAGTVLTEDTLMQALDAGADFIVSPGFDPDLVKISHAHGVPFLPGCATPSEALAAHKLGCELIKFFPGESLGGTKTLKDWTAALQGFRFMVTGGITKDNLATYLACPGVVCCGGRFIMPPALLEAGDVEGVKRTVFDTLRITESVRGVKTI